MVLAMTHEEIVTGHVAAAVRSYQRPAADPLPLSRSRSAAEARPARRAAHAANFIMKDSYTFDRGLTGRERGVPAPRPGV